MKTHARKKPAGSSGIASALTPLLDILFLLLFALLTLSEAKSADQRQVSVELPEVPPSPDPRRGEPAVLVLEVDAESHVLVAGSEEALGSVRDLDRALASAVGEGLPDETTVEIRADRDARHGTAVQLLEHLRASGFVNVRLAASDAGAGTDWLGGGAR